MEVVLSVDVKMREGLPAANPYNTFDLSRCGERMGYILEEHFVTLWRGWH